MKPERISEISLESHLPTLSLDFYSTFLPSSLHQDQTLFPSSRSLSNKCSRLHENYPRGQERLLTIRVRLLKRRRREVKVDPKLGGQWKDPKLGGQWKDPKLGGQWKDPKLGGHWKDPKLGGQWKVPKLGGQWKVPSLVAIGRIQSLVAYWNVKDKHLFTSSIFPQQLYLHPQFFPLTSRFYFTMVLSRYSRLPFLFFEL